MMLGRREFLSIMGGAALAAGREAPTAPVAVRRCLSYRENLVEHLGVMMDELGGLGKLVKHKTVTIKLNLTGSPGLRFQGQPVGVTHYNHPEVLQALIHLLDRAEARRIRLVESCWGTRGPLEEYLLEAGWSVRRLQSISGRLEFENTNTRGSYQGYATFRPAGGGYLFPSYQLNKAYEETDVFVSLAKLKNHETCGVTLSLKNIFGITPASIYGDDAGTQEPNENPTKGRLLILHEGKRQPAAIAAPEHDPSSSRDAGERVPRVVADLVTARPIDLAVIDGVETITGGEGPWIQGLRRVKPGLLVAGFNPVTTDAVATALMGYDPAAAKGVRPFERCQNTMLLAEARGVGTTDLKRIEVVGGRLEDLVYQFDSAGDPPSVR